MRDFVKINKSITQYFHRDFFKSPDPAFKITSPTKTVISFYSNRVYLQNSKSLELLSSQLQSIHKQQRKTFGTPLV